MCLKILRILLTIVLFSLSVTGQMGNVCDFDRDCNNTELWCLLGNCQCIAGVYYKNQCLPEVNYSQPCISEEQCQGLKCASESSGSQLKCLCDKHELYDYSKSECVYAGEELRFIMSKKEVTYGGDAVIPTLAGSYTWKTIMAAEILVMVFGLISILSVVTFCCYISYSDNKLRKYVNQAESKVGHYQKLSSNPPNEDPSTSAAFLEPVVVAQPSPIDVSIHFE